MSVPIGLNVGLPVERHVKYAKIVGARSSPAGNRVSNRRATLMIANSMNVDVDTSVVQSEGVSLAEILSPTATGTPPTPFGQLLAENTTTSSSSSQAPRLLALGGHRGHGANVWTATGPAAGRDEMGSFRENTIASFLHAVNAGATFIEFDVQVTSDGVPVIFHDNFVVYGPNSQSPTSSLVKNLSLADFKSLAPVASSNTLCTGSDDDDDDVVAGWSGDESNLGGMSPRSTTSSNTSNGSRLMRQHRHDIPANPDEHSLTWWEVEREDEFPTLAQVFDSIPEDVAFDIEVKMTTPADVQRTPQEEVDRVITSLLHAVETAAMKHVQHRQTALAGSSAAHQPYKPRTVVFSSFDPDICTEIKKRRPDLPVMFLTEAGAGYHADPRRISIPAAAEFAAENALQGIIVDTSILQQQPEAVAETANKGLVLMSYGLQNDDPMWVLMQQALGVHGVIVDDVTGVARAIRGALLQT